VRAVMCLHLKIQATQRHGYPRPDVVAQGYRPQEPGSAGTVVLAGRQGGRHNGASRMNMRGSVRVVGLVGVGEHAIHERRIHRPAQQFGTDHGRLLVPGMKAGKLERDQRRRQVGAGNHGGQSIEDVMLGFFLPPPAKSRGWPPRSCRR